MSRLSTRFQNSNQDLKRSYTVSAFLEGNLSLLGSSGASIHPVRLLRRWFDLVLFQSSKTVTRKWKGVLNGSKAWDEELIELSRWPCLVCPNFPILAGFATLSKFEIFAFLCSKVDWQWSEIEETFTSNWGVAQFFCTKFRFNHRAWIQ